MLAGQPARGRRNACSSVDSGTNRRAGGRRTRRSPLSLVRLGHGVLPLVGPLEWRAYGGQGKHRSREAIFSSGVIHFTYESRHPQY